MSLSHPPTHTHPYDVLALTSKLNSNVNLVTIKFAIMCYSLKKYAKHFAEVSGQRSVVPLFFTIPSPKPPNIVQKKCHPIL